MPNFGSQPWNSGDLTPRRIRMPPEDEATVSPTLSGKVLCTARPFLLRRVVVKMPDQLAAVLSRALDRRYGDGTLEPLDDAEELAANDAMVSRLLSGKVLEDDHERPGARIR